MLGGLEIFDLVGTNASKSIGAELRAKGVRVGVHTSPPHSNEKILCILQCGWWCDISNTPPQNGGARPPLKEFAMPEKDRRAMFDACAEWVKPLVHGRRPNLDLAWNTLARSFWPRIDQN